MPKNLEWPEGWSERTLVRCSFELHEYVTTVPPQIVLTVARCIYCGGPLEVVSLDGDPAGDG